MRSSKRKQNSSRWKRIKSLKATIISIFDQSGCGFRNF